MISDTKILERFKDWLYHADYDYSNIDDVSDIKGSIILNDNGELINTKNLFIDNSLKMDDSSGIKKSVIPLFKYSSLSEEEKKSFTIVEPAAFLLKGDGISPENPFIKTIGDLGFKLSDNSYPETTVNYKEQEITLNKLYSGDSGKIKNTNSNDIPLRKIMSSKSKVTFATEEEDKDKHRNKRLYVAGSMIHQNNVDDNFGHNIIKYLNGIINYNSTIENAVYHGECEYFGKNLGIVNWTINSICDGNFTAKGSELISKNLDSTDPRQAKFVRESSGWRLSLYENNVQKYSTLCESITKILNSNYPKGSLPLPVNILNNKINWTTFYKPNLDELCIISIHAEFQSNSETFLRKVPLKNFSIELVNEPSYSKSADINIAISFTTDLIDVNGNKLDLTKKYFWLGLSCLFFNSKNNQKMTEDTWYSQNRLEVDRDPFKGTFILKRVFSSFNYWED